MTASKVLKDAAQSVGKVASDVAVAAGATATRLAAALGAIDSVVADRRLTQSRLEAARRERAELDTARLPDADVLARLGLDELDPEFRAQMLPWLRDAATPNIGFASPSSRALAADYRSDRRHASAVIVTTLLRDTLLKHAAAMLREIDLGPAGPPAADRPALKAKLDREIASLLAQIAALDDALRSRGISAV